MITPRCTVQIVTWNSEKTLPDLFRSLRRQTLKDFHVIVVDNGSDDHSVECVAREYPQAAIIQNKENFGFCAAHNQGIRMAETPYVALINPDIVLEPNVLEHLLGVLDRHHDIGSVGAKLVREKNGKRVIDSAGLQARRTRQFINRGEGEADEGSYDSAEDVFGITGACVVFRREALESIRIGNEYLDEDLFAYKDDIDCAWRLLLAGWRNRYEPAAVVFHNRTVRHEKEYSFRARRDRKGNFINRLSYRNHLLLLTKNEFVRNWFVPFPKMLFYECAKMGYALLFERSTLLGFFDALRLMPILRRKRAMTLGNARRSPAAMRRFFT